MNAVRSVLLAWLLALAGGALAQAPVAPADTPEAQLFAAIDESKPLVAEGLVTRRKVDVNARNAERETPLHRAVETGMLPLVKLLIEAGANLRARSATGETPLHLAALHAEPALAETLLAAGAEATVRNDAGETVLFWAVLSGHGRTAFALASAGAGLNVADLKGNTPLHAAADGGYEAIARWLVANGAQKAARNRDGAKPEEVAHAAGHDKLADWLAGRASAATTPPAKPAPAAGAPAVTQGSTNFRTIEIDDPAHPQYRDKGVTQAP